MRMIGVVRDVVEEHQPGADRVFEIQDVEARRRLVQSIPVTPGVKPEKAADDQADRRLVRHDQDVLSLMGLDDGPDDRQRARHDVHTALPALGRDGERVFLPSHVLVAKAVLHLRPRQPFPVAVGDLAKTGPGHRRQLVRLGDECRRVHGAAHGRAVDGCDRVVGEAIAQESGLTPALVGQLDIG